VPTESYLSITCDELDLGTPTPRWMVRHDDIDALIIGGDQTYVGIRLSIDSQ